MKYRKSERFGKGAIAPPCQIHQLFESKYSEGKFILQQVPDMDNKQSKRVAISYDFIAIPTVVSGNPPTVTSLC